MITTKSSDVIYLGFFLLTCMVVHIIDMAQILSIEKGQRSECMIPNILLIIQNIMVSIHLDRALVTSDVMS